MSIWKPAPSLSVRALLISPDQSSICLIRREKKGRLYYVAPGGGLEKGESPVDGLRREISEETGLRFVNPVRRGSVHFEGRSQIYFSAEATDSKLNGHGIEHSLIWQTTNGLFHPEWVSFADLPQITFISDAVKQLLIRVQQEGWPPKEFAFRETKRNTSPLKAS